MRHHRLQQVEVVISGSSRLAFCVHAAGGLNKKISFVAKSFLDFVRSHFTRAQLLEPEVSPVNKYFLNRIDTRFNVFLKEWICIERWI